MQGGVLVRQALAEGGSDRVASVLSRMQEVEDVAAILSRLGVHLTDAYLGRSSDGPYVYYYVEPDHDGGIDGRYRALVDAAAEESDVAAEVVTAFDRLTRGPPESAAFAPYRPVGESAPNEASRSDCPPAED